MAYLVEGVTKIGDHWQRGNYYPAGKLPMLRDAEEFRSVWIYNEEMKPAADYLFIDVDEFAKAPKVKERLVQMQIPHQAYASGRGVHFHCAWPFDKMEAMLLPEMVRQYVGVAFPEADTSIYQRRGLIRRVGSRTKTGGYKVPITLDESVAEVKEKMQYFPTDMGFVDEYTELPYPLDDVAEKLVKNTPFIQAPSEGPFRCAWNALETVPQEGTRHENILMVAASFHSLGIPVEFAETLLHEWASKQRVNPKKPEDVRRLIRDVYAKGYSYSCNHTVRKRFCFGACSLMSALPPEPPAISTTMAVEPTLSFGLALGMPGVLRGGEVLTLLGKTGQGKSIVAQQLAVESPLPVIYYALDMSVQTTRERFNTMSPDTSHVEIKAGLDANLPESPHLIIIDTIDKLLTYTDIFKQVRESALRGLEWASKGHLVVMISHTDKNSSQRKGVSLYDCFGGSAVPQASDHVIGVEQDGKQLVLETLKSRNQAFKGTYATTPLWHRFMLTKFQKHTASWQGALQ